MDIETLIAKYDGPMPRYTSYPTAPHFTPDLNAGDYLGWLRAVPAGTAASLYIHVPFCHQLCWYCGCHTKAVRRAEPIARYVALLLEEIDLVAGAIGRAQKVAQIHLGGGTPSILGPKGLRRVFERLRARFDVAADAEIAIELDPRHLTSADIEALSEVGLTRASLGVQDLDPKVQVAIGRVQALEETEQAIRQLRAAGIASINVDLIYGLPHQTEAGAALTASQIGGLAPDRLAVFGYAHVPWMKRHQALMQAEALPDAPARFAQRAAIETVLLAQGYRAIGMDHYARPGDRLAESAAAGSLRRNFQGYTDDPAPVLIGLGVSSIGSFPEGYVQNLPELRDYAETLADGLLPVARGIRISEDDRLRRAVIEQVMCGLKVDLSAIAADWAEHFAADLDRLDALAADGLIERTGPEITVTAGGRPFVRAVAAAFDTYLGRGQGRHSRAV